MAIIRNLPSPILIFEARRAFNSYIVDSSCSIAKNCPEKIMKVNGTHYRTIWPSSDNTLAVNVIDQRKLPYSFDSIALTRPEDAHSAIKEMVVRGAGLIGVTAALLPVGRPPPSRGASWCSWCGQIRAKSRGCWCKRGLQLWITIFDHQLE